jgi:hypothetical protein
MYGIKVSNLGVDVGTADLRETSMRSDCNMFKIHSDGTQTGAIQAGQRAGTVTFTHGLGYIPAFWVYYIGTDGKQRQMSNFSGGDINWVSTYAGTDTITCIADIGYNYNQIVKSSWNDAIDSDGNFQMRVGDPGGGRKNCGVVYTRLNNGNDMEAATYNLLHGQTVETAWLDFYVSSKGTTTADGTLRYCGIDADQILSISDMSDPDTTAGGTQNVSNIPVGERFGMNVTSSVQEIIDRDNFVGGTAGTASGMGFHVYDVNFPSDKWFTDSSTFPYDTTLTITTVGSATFTFRVVIFKDKLA